jgi:hypothetical protein
MFWNDISAEYLTEESPIFYGSPYYPPPGWHLHCQTKGYSEDALPIVFKVILRTEDDFRELKELPRSFRRYPIVYESRPPCVGMSINAGGSIGNASPKTAGTAGGFLRDTGTGKLYVVSCAHVLGSCGDKIYTPGPLDSKKTTQIGTVKLEVLPSPNTLQGCNNRSHPLLSSLDLAIAEVDPGVAWSFMLPGLGRPSFVTPVLNMKTADKVVMFGKTSGRIDAELDSLCIYHEIDIDGQPRCFGDIFTMSHIHPWYINTDLIKSGDSGSWVLRSIDTATGWDGVAFAGDGAQAYACFAENVMASCLQNLSQNIVLVP